MGYVPPPPPPDRNAPPRDYTAERLRAAVRRVRSSRLRRFIDWNRCCLRARTHKRRLYSQWFSFEERYLWEVAVLSWRRASWSQDSYHGDVHEHYALTILQIGPWRVSLM